MLRIQNLNDLFDKDAKSQAIDLESYANELYAGVNGGMLPESVSIEELDL